MKFESEFGLGEVCIYNADAKRGDSEMRELLVKVVFVTFDLDGSVTYMVEQIGRNGMQRFNTTGANLTGDPDFDQENGYV